MYILKVYPIRYTLSLNTNVKKLKNVKKFIFLFNKMHELFDRIPFKIKIIENPHTDMLPGL